MLSRLHHFLFFFSFKVTFFSLFVTHNLCSVPAKWQCQFGQVTYLLTYLYTSWAKSVINYGLVSSIAGGDNLHSPAATLPACCCCKKERERERELCCRDVARVAAAATFEAVYWRRSELFRTEITTPVPRWNCSTKTPGPEFSRTRLYLLRGPAPFSSPRVSGPAFLVLYFHWLRYNLHVLAWTLSIISTACQTHVTGPWLIHRPTCHYRTIGPRYYSTTNWNPEPWFITIFFSQKLRSSEPKINVHKMTSNVLEQLNSDVLNADRLIVDVRPMLQFGRRNGLPVGTKMYETSTILSWRRGTTRRSASRPIAHRAVPLPSVDCWLLNTLATST